MDFGRKHNMAMQYDWLKKRKKRRYYNTEMYALNIC